MHIVIVGGGHNGLVAAWQLAEAGHQVDLFEKSASLGGACATERFECGCYINVGANAYGMFDPSLRKRLSELQAGRGFDVTLAQPAVVLPTEDGASLFISSDVPSKTVQSIDENTSDSGASASELFDFIGKATSSVADLWGDPYANVGNFRHRLAQVDPVAPEAFLSGSLTGLFRRFVSDPRTLALVAAGNLLLPASPSDAGTAFPMLYLGLSEVDGIPGWGVVNDGIARVADSLAAAASTAGARLHVSETVHRIVGSDGVASGVRLSDGDVSADIVVSNVDPVTTFLNLNSPELRLNEVSEARLLSRNFDGACAKINALLRRPIGQPGAGGYNGLDADPAQIVICPEINYLEEVFHDYQRRVPSSRPYVEITAAYVLDESASCGNHFPVSLYVLFCPYQRHNLASDRKYVLNATISAIRARIPSFSEQDIYWREVLLPVDIERRYGMHRGNVDHGPMSPTNRIEERPLYTAAAGSTPIRNLYLCGSGIHPGGLVSGRAGSNATRVILDSINGR